MAIGILQQRRRRAEQAEPVPAAMVPGPGRDRARAVAAWMVTWLAGQPGTARAPKGAGSGRAAGPGEGWGLAHVRGGSVSQDGAIGCGPAAGGHHAGMSGAPVRAGAHGMLARGGHGIPDGNGLPWPMPVIAAMAAGHDGRNIRMAEASGG